MNTVKLGIWLLVGGFFLMFVGKALEILIDQENELLRQRLGKFYRNRTNLGGWVVHVGFLALISGIICFLIKLWTKLAG